MSKQQEYQKRKVAQGLCSTCGKRPLYSSDKCILCYQKCLKFRKILNAGKYIDLRMKEKEIIREIRDRLKNINQKSKYGLVTKIISVVASNYCVCENTIRNICKRNKYLYNKRTPEKKKSAFAA